MMKVNFRIGLALMMGLSFAAAAEIPGLVPEKNWALNGYVNYRLSSYLVQNGSDSLEQSLQQRFNYEYRFNSDVRFNAGMRNRVVYGGTVDTSGYADWFGRDAGYFDLSANWMKEDTIIGNSQFDRLYLSWQPGDWLIRGGRFRVNWGMTTIWNPNDIFNTYSVYDTDYAERPGTDGVLLSRKLGFASGAELVFSPARDSQYNRYAARYYFNHQGWDGQLISGKSVQDTVIGVGFAGDINGAGVRGESSYFEPTEDTQKSQSGSAVISSLELDYSFVSERNWSIRAGVLHTSAPDVPDSSTTYLTQPLSTRTLSFTAFTGYAEAGFDLTPLNRSAFSVIYYQDDSVYLNYTNQYSLADNWQLTASIQHFDGPDFSLFGITPTTVVYMMVRWNW